MARRVARGRYGHVEAEGPMESREKGQYLVGMPAELGDSKANHRYARIATSYFLAVNSLIS